MGKAKIKLGWSKVVTLLSLFLCTFFISRISAFGYLVSLSVLIGVLDEEIDYLWISLEGIVIMATAIIFMPVFQCLATVGVFLIFVFARKIAMTLPYLFESLCAVILTLTFYLFQKPDIKFAVLIAALCVLSGILAKWAKGGIKKSIVGERVTKSEFVAISILLLLLGAGIAEIELISVSLLFLMFPFFLLLVLYFLSPDSALIFSLIFGLSSYAAFGGAGGMIYCVIIAFVAISLCDAGKLITVLSLLGTSVILLGVFVLVEGNIILSIVMSSVSILAFLLIPKKWFEVSALKLRGRERGLSKLLVNRARRASGEKIRELECVFEEIALGFEGIKKHGVSGDLVANMAIKEVDSLICRSCEQRGKCKDAYAKRVEEDILTITLSGLARGTANLLDLPEFLSKNCIKVNDIFKKVNECIAHGNVLSERTESEDECKEVLKKQFSAIAGSLSKLSEELSRELEFSKELDFAVRENLSNANVNFEEVFCFFENSNEPKVYLWLKGGERMSKKLTRIVSDACGMNMRAERVSQGGKGRGNSLLFVSSAKFDIIFGIAAKKKVGSEISGDTHSLTRTTPENFVISISDGMGSGSKARNISEKTISLVENMYKAGFDEEIVPATVNNLLSFSESEVFATIDLLSVNLVTGAADFIKLGAPSSFILSKEVFEVGGESLPLGILDKVVPSKKRVKLAVGDFFILMSDGVADAVGSIMARFLTKKRYFNPQTLAEELLAEANERVDEDKQDDMTVIVGKLVEEK